MDYKVRVPKFLGDVIPLHCVADAMAEAKATACSTTPFHGPAYDGLIGSIRQQLLDAAKKGLLQVCDQGSFAAPVDELIARAKQEGSFMNVKRFIVEPDWAALQEKHPECQMASGAWDWSRINLGKSKVDVVSSELHCLHATLKQLNVWGSNAGNTFSIDPDAPPWVDERGVMGMAEEPTHRGKSPPVNKVVAGTVNNKHPWAPEAVRLASEYITAWREEGYEPTKQDAALYIEGEFSTRSVYGTRGNVLDAAYIERWGLAGITGRSSGFKSKKPKVPEGKRGKLPERK